MRKFLVVLILTGFLIVVQFPSSFSFTHVPSDTSVTHVSCHNSELLETASPGRTSPVKPGNEFKVISYNIRWRSGDDLRKLGELMKESPTVGGATILGLQEVDRNKKRSGNKNSAAILAEQLGMHYAWAAPPVAKNEKEEETGVAILSAYPLSHVCRLVLPHKGPGGRRRVALGATIKVGQTDLRVYSVHSETRMAVGRKLEQTKAVINDLSRHHKKMAAVILGDLNTWEPAAVSKTSKLLVAEVFHTPFDGANTFSRNILFVPLRLKLDWIWLRHLEATNHGIDRTITLSDHWPLWITLKTPEPG